MRQSTPEAGLTLLREALEDLHTLLMDLTQLSRIPYGDFTAVGKMLYREVRRSHILALLIDKKFKPIHDRITSPAVAATIRAIAEPTERKHAARVFLELFRLLHYLEYADPAHADEDHLKNTILIFSLITSETRLLLTYLERRVLKALDPDSPAFALYDSFVYCLPLELKKVINTELLDISVTRQPDIVRARVENSHGILKDCFQQSVVQLAQVFDAEVEGHDIFPDFTAKLEQSVRAARQPGPADPGRAAVPGHEGRIPGRGHEGRDLRLLRPQHEVPHVPRLVGVRAVLHRDPEVHEPARAGADHAPLRDLPHDALPRGPEALDPAERACPREPARGREHGVVASPGLIKSGRQKLLSQGGHSRDTTVGVRDPP